MLLHENGAHNGVFSSSSSALSWCGLQVSLSLMGTGWPQHQENPIFAFSLLFMLLLLFW
jgi:hypothetical protein